MYVRVVARLLQELKINFFENFLDSPGPFRSVPFEKILKTTSTLLLEANSKRDFPQIALFSRLYIALVCAMSFLSYLYIHTFIICITITLRTCWTSGGKTINCELDIRLYIFSMKMPVRIALATDRNEGRSSFDLLGPVSCLAKVEANHLRTSSGTASDCNSDKSSPMVSSL